MKIVAAFYHYKTPITDWQSFKKRLTHELICLFTRSCYSHVEIAVNHWLPNSSSPLYICYGASARDGGVRRKEMMLPPDKWVLVTIKNPNFTNLYRLYQTERGKSYDYSGALRAICSLFPDCADRWTCSEFAACALNLPKGAGITPKNLYQYLILTGLGKA